MRCSLSIGRKGASDIDPVRVPRTDTEAIQNNEFHESQSLPFSQPSAAPPGRCMELMHHYSVATAETLALRLDMQHVWHVIIPELGYDEQFLSHGILSIAALHKAYLLPVRRTSFLDLAAYHQSRGMAEFRGVLANITDQTWEACFCFSMIIAACALFAALQAPDAIEEIVNIFTLIRGIRYSLSTENARITNTPLAPLSYGIWIMPENDDFLYEQDLSLDGSNLPSEIFRALRRIKLLFRTSLPESSQTDYDFAAQQLRKAAVLIARAGSRPEIGMLLFFPYVISQDILTDIRRKNPYAMVLLSYFALLLSALEPRFWYIQGWSERLFEAIETNLSPHQKLSQSVRGTTYEIDAYLLPKTSVFVLCFSVLFTAWALQTLLGRDSMSHIPVMGKGSKWTRRKTYASGGAWDLYREGYSKYKDKIFRLATGSRLDFIVVSPKYLPELRKLPDDVLSFAGAIEEFTHAEYTQFETEGAALVRLIKTRLTPALGKISSIISDEVIGAMALHLPQTSEWQEVDVNEKLLRIVAIVSGRIFVGPELCHDKQYLDIAINYTVDVMIAVYFVGLVPLFIRPYIAPFLPSIKKLRTRLDEADKFLRPIVEARRAVSKDANAAKPDDLLQWILESEAGEQDDKAIAKTQLSVSMAAIHTTTLTITNALYTLAVMPELVPELVEDVQQALTASDGDYSTQAMQNMKKLDSFLKETMRFYPHSASIFQRKVLKPFTLSTGEYIPKGAVIETSAIGVNTDDGVFEDAETFDPYRFYKLRQAKDKSVGAQKAAEVVANSQFISVSESNLAFGYGRHACPGRFFAANEIKMILANILLHYEIRNPIGVVERHKNIRRASQVRYYPEPDNS
ncbi:ent-kaurene oxidase [Paramyrothecium foliicola]|nr:ent-kaurene oxidase [Paramyrothecium foliicola]